MNKGGKRFLLAVLVAVSLWAIAATVYVMNLRQTYIHLIKESKQKSHQPEPLGIMG